MALHDSRSLKAAAMVLALSMLASACNGTATDEGPREPLTGQEIDSILEGAFEDAGILVSDDPGQTRSGRSPLSLITFQVEGMRSEVEHGNGYLGSELDDLVGSPGGLPFSFLIAGWLADIDTPLADAGRELMGDQDWTQAPHLLFPSAVLTFFVADVLDHSSNLEATATDNGARGVLAAYQVGNLCSTFQGGSTRS